MQFNNYMFDNKTFNYYISLLQSKDNRTIIMGLQEIFFRFEAGGIMYYQQRCRLEPEIINIISNNDDSRTRRWAYMIGAFCFNRELVRVCKLNIDKESDFENRTWIMSILAANLTDSEFNKAVLELNHGLTIEEIKLATYLFQNNEQYRLTKEDINKIVSSNDKIGLFWIGSNAAYHKLARLKNKEIIISNDIVSELTRHNDDEVLKHLMYAFSCQGSIDVKKDIHFDYDDFTDMEPHHKKWFLTAIWSDHIFIENNRDYICEILGIKHLASCDKRVREGLARGLSEYCYAEFLVRSVLEWLSYEGEESVRYFLLRYAIKCRDNCDDYKEIIYDELINEGVSGAKVISTFLTPTESDSTNKVELIGKPNKRRILINADGSILIEEEVYTMDKDYKGSGDIFVNKDTMVGAQGSQSQLSGIVIQNKVIGKQLDYDYDGVLKELDYIYDELYSLEEHRGQNASLIGKTSNLQEAAKNKDHNKFVAALKAGGQELLDIAKRVGCSLLATYLAGQLGI